MQFLLLLALIGIVIGSATDIKKREVPDWVSYSMMVSGIGIRMLFAIALLSWQPLLAGVYGVLVCAVVANVMYYLGQWGGGDAKALMGVGALVGIAGWTRADFTLAFLLNLIIAGALYGLAYSLAIGLLRPRRTWTAMRSAFTRLPKQVYALALVIVALIIVCFAILPMREALYLAGTLTGLLALLLILWSFAKAVEDSAMLQWVAPSRLTEGDWIAKDVMVGRKRITGPKDLGVTRAQIRLLKKLHREGKVKKVLLKVGIPFMPAFLIAFIMTLLWGNVLLVAMP